MIAVVIAAVASCALAHAADTPADMNAPAAVHEKDAELMSVIEGTGTVVTGGKLANEKRTNAANLSGSSIEGGTSQTPAKGDFVIVPEKAPHQIAPAAARPSS